MPIVPSTYKPSGIFKNGHFSTIFSAKLRYVQGVRQERQRMVLKDGDFVDIDWSFSEAGKEATKIVFLLHGLEGNAQRPYILGQARILNENGYDCAAINLRGCSGEINKAYSSYHSGATEDLAEVLDAIAKTRENAQLFLCGFSLGGNIVLKYLGEERSRPPQLQAAAAISTPVNLKSSLLLLGMRQNTIYHWSFLKGLRKKYRQKMTYFPQKMDQNILKKIKNLRLFDELYTAPANGFTSAADYYEKSSSLAFLPDIQVPTLLLNAANDSFLDAACYPEDAARNNKKLVLEIPEYGGHVGFHRFGENYFSEQRVLSFFEENL